MIKKTYLIIALCLLLFTACKHQIKSSQLYGDWKYIKIDRPKSDDAADTVTKTELAENTPFISFSKNNELSIHWGGKILSHGTFNITGDNINYTEQLPGGKTRTFPFWVSKLDDKTLVFETLGTDGSRVTAVK